MDGLCITFCHRDDKKCELSKNVTRVGVGEVVVVVEVLEVPTRAGWP